MHTAQKMKFFIKDFFTKCDQVLGKLRVWSHLLIESLMENFIFGVVAKANNKCMKGYGKNKESSYLQYWDVNNLFGWTMSQNLPVNNFE